MSKYWKKVRKSISQFKQDSSLKLIKIAYNGERANSELEWHRLRNPLRMLFTALVFEILRKTPPCGIKNSIYRMFGVNIGKDVAVAYNVLPDPLFPELLTIEDGVLIGSDCELATHEFARNSISLGRNVIKKYAMLSGYTVVRAGTTIGENAITGLYTFVNKDVGKDEFVGGIPAKLIKKIKPEDLKMKTEIELMRYNSEK